MLATIPVTLASDAGSPVDTDNGITLREAISYVNGVLVPDGDKTQFDFANLGTNDKIVFDLPAGQNKITLGRDAAGDPIPSLQGFFGHIEISEAVTIDAQGQSITIDASGTDSTPSTADGNGSSIFDIGLTITGSADQNVILRGLTLTGADAGSLGAIVFSETNIGAHQGSAILSIDQSLVAANHASGGVGGGLTMLSGELVVSQSAFVANTTNILDGGAIFVGSGVASVAIDSSDFMANQSGGNGGAIALLADDDLASVTITDSNFLGNKADSGGALYADLVGAPSLPIASRPVLSISDSVFDSNEASLDGGGIWVCTKHGATFELNNSTISNNQVTSAVGVHGRGGGLWMGFLEAETADDLIATLENVTISGNSAPVAGGGIWIGFVPVSGRVAGGIAGAFNHVTITENQAPVGGGLFSTSDSRISTTLTNTIVSGNEVSDTNSAASNVGGAVEALDSVFNLLGSNNGSFAGLPATSLGNIHNDTPLLDSLRDNGGGTETHLPATGSPAIDAGDPTGTDPPFDQRGTGFLRVLGTQRDIGAV